MSGAVAQITVTRVRRSEDRDGNLTITLEPSKADWWKARRFLEEMAAQPRPLEVTFKEPKKQRSLNQNAYFWALVGEIARMLGADNYSVYLALLESYTTPIWLMLPKAAKEQLLKEPFRVISVQDEHEGGTVTALCWYSSQYLNTAEFSRLLDATLEEARQVGIDPEAVRLGLMDEKAY